MDLIGMEETAMVSRINYSYVYVHEVMEINNYLILHTTTTVTQNHQLVTTRVYHEVAS